MGTKRKSETQRAGKAVQTHNVGIDLPANKKYLSRNPINRLLIRKFMDGLMTLLKKPAL